MKIRVLVVEDEPPIQRSICQKIEESNENYIVVAAIDNGKDAIQYLKEYPVDVMFVDMNLPIVSGKELLKFCYSEKLPVLPVVLSGYTDFEYVKCAVANHAVDYLLKPLNSQELKLILQKIEIRIREQQQEEKIQNLTDAIKGFNTLQTKESNSEKNPSYSMLLISLGACPYENERNYRELFEKLDLEGNFSQIVSEENFWLVNGKNINEKIIFVRRDQVPDINHLNQFVRSLKFLGLTITIVFYNSYVIQPMLIDVLAVMKEHKVEGADFYDVQLQRLIRYADQQEKMISPEGTYPVLGRSMGYRFGAFQVLAQVSWMKLLPEHIKPAQVRCALTKVMKRQLAKGTFDKDGWLNLGFCGHQPEIADRYVSTGSNYLCTFIFLPLGLQADDEFWTAKPEKWSSVKIWSGSRDIKKDGSIRN